MSVAGFSVLQLLQSVLFAVSMNRLPQIAVVDEGDSLFINWVRWFISSSSFHPKTVFFSVDHHTPLVVFRHIVARRSHCGISGLVGN